MVSKMSFYCDNYSEILVSDNMGGKMEGVPAVSTSCLMNPYCLARLEKAIDEGDTECICIQCYAMDGVAYKKGLRDNLLQNFELLNSRVLSEEELIKVRKFVEIFRIEAFGDAASVTQCINYINIVNINPHVTFTAWTKNPNLWNQAFEMMGKPSNLIMVLSSEKKNVVTDLYKKYEWVDHVFTVYSIDWLKENNIDIEKFINCGGNKCNDCRNCYGGCDNFFINEMLKCDARKYYKDKIKKES